MLGYLKMPGYSDYLHPLNATHVIGLGMGGTATGRINGVKLALFDASDVEAPDIAFATEVGGSGSHSAATDDHKAFLFDASRRLLTLPISVATEQGAACSAESASHWSQWRSSVTGRHALWQGTLTWRVTEASFELLGAVSHYEPTAETYLEREVDTPPSQSYNSSSGRWQYGRSNRCGYAEHAEIHIGCGLGTCTYTCTCTCACTCTCTCVAHCRSAFDRMVDIVACGRALSRDGSDQGIFNSLAYGHGAFDNMTVLPFRCSRFPPKVA